MLRNPRRLLAATTIALVALLGLPRAASAASAGHMASGASCTAAVEAIDVSRWQGNINWQLVAQRKAGAWIKVSGSDGGNYRDALATQNMNGATAAGLPWGTYHFAGIYSPDSGWQEADYAISQGFGSGTLPPMLDLETNPRGLSAAGLTQWALDFANRTHERTGRTVVIYTGAYTGLGGDRRLASYGLAIANYGPNTPNSSPCSRPNPPVPDAWSAAGWTVWQHNSTTGVAGISGNVDQDIIDPAAWASWTGSHVDPNPNTSGTNDPATADSVVWHNGSTGPKVQQIQRIVGVPADGSYGPQTTAAVARWQRALGLPADGVWGPQTEASTAAFFGFLASLPAVPPVPPTISIGARGATVTDLQRRLQARGYWVSADGVFGARTRAAVLDWQARNGLVRDGIVGPATWRTL